MNIGLFSSHENADDVHRNDNELSFPFHATDEQSLEVKSSRYFHLKMQIIQCTEIKRLL